MSETRAATRTVFVLTRGARLCLLIAVLMVMFAAYLFFAPIDIQTPEGPMFNCGSAARPPAAGFQRNSCGRLDQARQLQAAFIAGAGVITALGGLFVFGASRRTEALDDEPPADEPPRTHP